MIDVLFFVVAVLGAGLFRISSNGPEDPQPNRILQGAGIGLIVLAMLGLSGSLVHTPGLSAILMGGLALMGLGTLLMRPNAKHSWLVLPLFIVGGLTLVASLFFIQADHSKRKQQRNAQVHK